ncbi:hypothetical protein JKP88DRAFT_166382 [Tribonema minus]|uniref:Uncharacterized protein n=1 Tax=Tribonema minus TaxID=303371 RepID=A0A835YST1_9STRA|nr:hypothetical protein JKP88DRAFT_166382 [Tribonema minus]
MRGRWCWLAALPALSAGHRALAVQHHIAAPQGAKRVLLLDVDGTLYGPEAGVEQQIVANIHRFVEQELSITPQQCDQLHHRQVNDGPKDALYGSTIEGLQAEGLVTPAQVQAFYHSVYKDIDLSGLYPQYSSSSRGDATGYRHRIGWTRLLRHVPCSKYVASNSPRRHVLRVLRALGLADVHWSGILCPDTTGGFTKANPLFYQRVVESHPVEQGWQVTLVDDSRANLEVARAGCGFEAVLLAPHEATSEDHCTHSEVMDRAADLPTALAR